MEFVSRCVTTPEVYTNEEEPVKTLMPPKVVAVRKKKKRVKVWPPGTTTPEWKPSLYMISEDNVTAEETTSKTSDRVVKRKSSSGSSLSKVHVRSYNGDIG